MRGSQGSCPGREAGGGRERRRGEMMKESRQRWRKGGRGKQSRQSSRKKENERLRGSQAGEPNRRRNVAGETGQRGRREMGGARQEKEEHGGREGGRREGAGRPWSLPWGSAAPCWPLTTTAGPAPNQGLTCSSGFWKGIDPKVELWTEFTRSGQKAEGSWLMSRATQGVPESMGLSKGPQVT